MLSTPNTVLLVAAGLLLVLAHTGWPLAAWRALFPRRHTVTLLPGSGHLFERGMRIMHGIDEEATQPWVVLKVTKDELIVREQNILERWRAWLP